MGLVRGFILLGAQNVRKLIVRIWYYQLRFPIICLNGNKISSKQNHCVHVKKRVSSRMLNFFY